MSWLSFLANRKAPEQISPEVSEVYSQLIGLKNSRHFAWISFRGESKPYQSMILDADPHAQEVILDEPFGLPKQFLWTPGQALTVAVKGTTQVVEFKSRFCRLEPAAAFEQNSGRDPGHHCIIQWPEMVSQHQRRATFRVSFHGHSAVPLVQLSGGEDVYPCMDLSAQGIGMAVSTAVSNRISAGQTIDLTLHLPDHASGTTAIQTRVAVKRQEPVDELNLVCIGGELEGLSTAARRTIDRFLVVEQRKSLKEQSSG